MGEEELKRGADEGDTGQGGAGARPGRARGAEVLGTGLHLGARTLAALSAEDEIEVA